MNQVPCKDNLHAYYNTAEHSLCLSKVLLLSLIHLSSIFIGYLYFLYQIVAGQRIIRDRQKDTHKYYNRLRKMTRSIYIPCRVNWGNDRNKIKCVFNSSELWNNSWALRGSRKRKIVLWKPQRCWDGTWGSIKILTKICFRILSNSSMFLPSLTAPNFQIKDEGNVGLKK